MISPVPIPSVQEVRKYYYRGILIAVHRNMQTKDQFNSTHSSCAAISCNASLGLE